MGEWGRRMVVAVGWMVASNVIDLLEEIRPSSRPQRQREKVGRLGGRLIVRRRIEDIYPLRSVRLIDRKI